MKRLAIAITVMILLALPMLLSAQTQQQTWIQKNKFIYSNTSRTDTSTAQLLTGYYPVLHLGIYVGGTDSARIVTRVDYKIGDKWIPISSVGDTLLFGKLMTNKVGARGYVLRAYATDLVPGATEIRTRNTITGYSSGDSTGQGKYTQYLLQRSP